MDTSKIGPILGLIIVGASIGGVSTHLISPDPITHVRLGDHDRIVPADQSKAVSVALLQELRFLQSESDEVKADQEAQIQRLKHQLDSVQTRVRAELDQKIDALIGDEKAALRDREASVATLEAKAAQLLVAAETLWEKLRQDQKDLATKIEAAVQRATESLQSALLNAREDLLRAESKIQMLKVQAERDKGLLAQRAEAEKIKAVNQARLDAVRDERNRALQGKLDDRLRTVAEYERKLLTLIDDLGQGKASLDASSDRMGEVIQANQSLGEELRALSLASAQERQAQVEWLKTVEGRTDRLIEQVEAISSNADIFVARQSTSLREIADTLESLIGRLGEVNTQSVKLNEIQGGLIRDDERVKVILEAMGLSVKTLSALEKKIASAQGVDLVSIKREIQLISRELKSQQANIDRINERSESAGASGQGYKAPPKAPGEDPLNVTAAPKAEPTKSVPKKPTATPRPQKRSKSKPYDDSNALFAAANDVWQSEEIESYDCNQLKAGSPLEWNFLIQEFYPGAKLQGLNAQARNVSLILPSGRTQGINADGLARSVGCDLQ